MPVVSHRRNGTVRSFKPYVKLKKMPFNQLKEQLDSLYRLLNNLSDQQYRQPIHYLGNSSIGGHTRHIIELLNCAVKAHSSGIADYQNRARDLRLESDRSFAVAQLCSTMDRCIFPDKDLKLAIDDQQSGTIPELRTTYYREIVYHTEHTVHHLAMIRVALRELNLEIVDDRFGLAYSTIRYQSALQVNN